MIFGTLKDGSLIIYILPLNIFLQIHRHLEKWRQQGKFFVKKLKFCTFRTIRFDQNSSACGLNTYQIIYNIWRDFRLPVSAFATVAWNSLTLKGILTDFK